LATRAVYTFTGFPEAPLRHLYLGLPEKWKIASAAVDLSC
jgi:hypothetical protein